MFPVRLSTVAGVVLLLVILILDGTDGRIRRKPYSQQIDTYEEYSPRKYYQNTDYEEPGPVTDSKQRGLYRKTGRESHLESESKTTNKGRHFNQDRSNKSSANGRGIFSALKGKVVSVVRTIKCFFFHCRQKSKPKPTKKEKSPSGGAETTKSTDENAETTESTDENAETTESADENTESTDENAETTESADENAETTESTDTDDESAPSADDAVSTVKSVDHLR